MSPVRRHEGGRPARRAGTDPDHIDEIDISTDPELEARYGLEIPVLLVDGKKAAKYRCRRAELTRILRLGQQGSGIGCEAGRLTLIPFFSSYPASAARLPALFRGHHKMPPPILRPAGLGLVAAERLFLALADDE